MSEIVTIKIKYDLPIDSLFRLEDSRTYKVCKAEEDCECEKCQFGTPDCFALACATDERADKTPVYFKEVEEE